MALTKANGLNGHTNGALKGSKATNGHASGPVSKRASTGRTGPSFFGRLFSIAARLLTWYSIITILFRCPPTPEACDETTPRVCKPYFQVKQAVSPHLSPYYDAYAAPYVEFAKPYYETVDRALISPGRTYAVKYAGPRVAQAQALGKAQWEKAVQPQIIKYQDLAKVQYDQNLAPHVNTATKVIGPYYTIAKTNALQTYHEIVFPAYVAVAPYAIQGYNAVHDFSVNTALPSGLWAWDKTNAFLDSTVWPQVHDIYAAKVEPQLVRIGERLGRYSEKKPRAASVEDIVEEVTSKASLAKSSSPATTPSTASTSVESVATAESQTTSEILTETSNADPEATPAVPVEDDTMPDPEDDASLREKASKIVQEDLDLWEAKFSKVAEEGAAEIENRIDELAEQMFEDEVVRVGRPLMVKMFNTILSEDDKLKGTIAESLKTNVDNQEQLDEDVRVAIRSAGLAIKNSAQACRDWRQQFDQELEQQVTAIVAEHFEILEGTRDLAVQKIGMKWAWMDGVTYKDWQKYHELKDKFGDWINDLKNLIVTHPALLETQKHASHVDEEAVGTAAHAAQGLIKIKDVVRLKQIAGDFTKNFDPETMEKAAKKAEQKRAEAARIKAEEDARLEAEAAEAVKQAAADATASAHKVLREAKESAMSAAGHAGESASSLYNPGQSAETIYAETDSETSAVPPLDSLTEEPTESATDLAPDATNKAERFESLPVDDAIEDKPEQFSEELVEESAQPLPPVETPEVKSAWLGAAAQAAPSRKPIIDEEYLESAESIISVVQSDVPASITSAAQAAYTAAVANAADQYSKAMSVASVQISGKPKPLQEQMFSSASNAYFSALASANVGLNSALTAASQGVYGTPTNQWMPPMPTVPSVDWERVQSIAQQNLDDSLGWANKQYESAKTAAVKQVEAAKIAVGAAEPSPSTYLEAAEKQAQKIREQAQHNYYAGLGVAYARYSEFLSAASTAVSSLTASPTPTNIQGSASSAASVAQASASSVASVASGSAASIASEAAEMAFNAGDSVSDTFESMMSAVSSQIYGAPVPTPWYENVYDTASEQYSQAVEAVGDYAAAAGSVAGDYASAAGDYATSATDAAGEQLSQVTSVVSDYAISASSAAELQYSAVSSLVSELIVGKEPTFSESVYSRLAGAYTFGYASASSIASVAAETIVSAASEVTESASSVISVVEETFDSATDKVKETIESIKDEL